MGVSTGTYIAAGCDIGSAGACVAANPLIIGAGVAIGLLGGVIADALGDWLVDGMLWSEPAPKDAPPGTRPIDQWGIGKDDVHGIKDGVGAGPKDWTGVTPGGNVITVGPNGEAIDNGHVDDYTNKPIKKFPRPK